MGHLRKGQWHSGNVATANDAGEFDREKSEFRETISNDHERYQPEANRYHLYVSYACPWAHRTLIMRKLKGLEDAISFSIVHPHMLDKSWTFDQDFPGATGDDLYGLETMYQIYLKHDPQVTTKVTVPVLWDKKNESIVNNESSEIIRILNSAFNDFAKNQTDFCPQDLLSGIDKWNEKTYEPINNGVYKCGFAQTQEAYQKAFTTLFSALEEVEAHLESHDYLVGDQLTEADVRLVTTLLRFDPVYFGHFKCNKKRIIDFPHLHAYAKKLYENPAIKETTHVGHIKEHYYYSHEFLNPKRIVPLGPETLF